MHLAHIFGTLNRPIFPQAQLVVLRVDFFLSLCLSQVLHISGVFHLPTRLHFEQTVLLLNNDESLLCASHSRVKPLA